MVRAYVLIENAPGQPSWTDGYAGSIGFGMCKGLYHRLRQNKVVLHLDCADLESLNEAITVDSPKLKGFVRLTVCIVSKS